jgi:hypothetical protein
VKDDARLRLLRRMIRIWSKASREKERGAVGIERRESIKKEEKKKKSSQIENKIGNPRLLLYVRMKIVRVSK